MYREVHGLLRGVGSKGKKKGSVHITKLDDTPHVAAGILSMTDNNISL
jgi:hypothetical protein